MGAWRVWRFNRGVVEKEGGGLRGELIPQCTLFSVYIIYVVHV